MTMRVVIFGQLNKSQEYSRSFILTQAFEKLGCKLIFCTMKSGFIRPDLPPLFKIAVTILTAPFRWVRLISKYFFLPGHALIFVPYPAHIDAWAACLLGKWTHHPVIVDVFFGLYDTIIRDRRLFTPESMMAKLIWNYEKQVLRSVTSVLVDTDEHMLMLKNDYDIPEHRLTAIPVGIDESLWVPTAFPGEKIFQVVYWSTFIPLHGVEVIAIAAKLIENNFPDVRIIVIGKGQEDKKFESIIKQTSPVNLIWIRRFIPLEKIQEIVAKSHCCLGLFGKQEKTQRAIPYKAYQALASSKALITGRTCAIEKYFTDGVNVLLVNLGDPVDLSIAILKLAKDRILTMSIGKNGRLLYESMLSNEVIERKLSHIIESICQ